MFWLLLKPETGQKVAETTAKTTEAAGGGEHLPPIVNFVNHYLGEYALRFELKYTRPAWAWFFTKFGTTPEAVFGEYTKENAIPWYTIMFIIACIICVAVVWILKGRLSEDEPGHGQQTLEVGVLAVRGLLQDVVGPHGLKYFPVVATFAILILISNLMGLVPGLMSPSASTSVTFALGISSFVYYNYIGIKENGLMGHLGHFAGVNYFSGLILFLMGPAMFVIELISNAVRPLSLGLRLFGNIFGDEQVGTNISGLADFTHWGIPAILMVLSVFAAVMQTFIFTLLSMIYIGEVSHAPHEHHGEAGEHEVEGDEIIAPVLT